MDDEKLVPVSSPGVPLWYGTAGAPLVVVLHDWYGRLSPIEHYAQSVAEHGFRVALPDLYDGVATTDASTAERLVGQLAVDRALAALDECIAAARREGSRRCALVGFSMGGSLSLEAAARGSADAVVAYYATLAEDHNVLLCPVLLHFAEHDDWEAGSEPEQFLSRLKDHGTPVSAHEYLGTRHSFANAIVPAAFDARAAALAFARTTAFLERELAD